MTPPPPGLRLLLIRHGNTFEPEQTPTQVGLHTDLPLTQQGREQASRVGLSLSCQGITPDAVFCGHLLRQRQTAQALIPPGGKLYAGETALDEIDYGLWEGLTSEEIHTGWPRAYADWTQKGLWPEGIFGRSKAWHQKAIADFLRYLSQTYTSNQTVVVVSSNGVLGFFYEQALPATYPTKKVRTGHLCEVRLQKTGLIDQICYWDRPPT